MPRKILLSLLLGLIGTNVAFADVIPYVGLDLGYQMPHWTLTDTSQVKTTYTNSGVVGNLFAGLGGMMNRTVYMGIEGFASEQSTRSSTKNITINGQPSTAMIRSRWSYGGSFIPGINFKNRMRFYGRLGVIRTHYQVHQSVVSPGAPSNISGNTATGGQLGIGFQSLVASAVAIRVEYDYSAYRSYWAFGYRTTPATTRIVTRDNLIKVGLVFILC